MASVAQKIPRRFLGLVLLVALAINGATLLSVAHLRPAYLADYRLNTNPDAVQYVQLGVNVWTKGVYSRQDAAPYAPDVLRTPIYPLVAGGIQAATGRIWPLYVAQILFALATAALLTVFTARQFGVAAGITAGLLCAVDPMLSCLNFEAMSDPLFVLLSSGAIWLWIRLAVSGTDSSPQRLWLGALVGVAILTRPSGLYLPLALGATEIAVRTIQRGRPVLRGAVVAMLVSYVVVAPWVVRNYALVRLPKLTTADTINLLYFAGAGVYQVRYGIDRETAQARIAADYQLPTVEQSNNPWLVDRSIASMDSAERQAAWRIFRSDPPALALASATGLMKALFSHNVAKLAEITGYPWGGGNIDRLRSGIADGVSTLLRTTPPLLVSSLVGQLCCAVTVVLLGFVGVVMALRNGAGRLAAAMLLAALSYNLMTIGIVGIDAYARHRAPVTPILCVFAGLAVARIWERVAHRTKPG